MRGAALVALLLAAPSVSSAQVTVSPYFMVMFDTSGSMNISTGTGNNSCGIPRTRMADAKCVLQNVVNGYGEATFGLERFRSDACSGTCSSTTCGFNCGCSCFNYCDATSVSGEVLVPIREAPPNQQDIIEWIDYQCTSCTSLTPGAQPELDAEGNTPITGSLRAAREYYQGLDPRFPGPIASDPFRGCRPYYVILMTDGAETCGGTPSTAATELRTTNVGGVNYDIRTFVIGFGIAPGDAQIESIATAGGTDAPGANRGFYATDETSLALAFSQIMEDAILYETCDGSDNDCDGAIDEGFTLYCNRPMGINPPPTLCTNPGETVCDGIDDNCNGTVDEGLRNACGTCGPAPAEVCNGVDDNCNGVIDEGGVCMGCIPSPEICDNISNDCDVPIDEGLTRPCGTDVGVCTTGTETCMAGAWGTCSGIGPSAELCDNLDNDCDGVTDGITRPCGISTGECEPGTETCTSGAWGMCSGGTGPATEICDNRDNDCDGAIDDGNPGGGGTCGTGIGECEPGTLTCMGGALVCTGGVSASPESCDNRDNDCDGATDESVPPMGSCGTSTGACEPGILRCSAGSFVCTGAIGPVAEACNGQDDDCDGPIDEGNPGGGGTCGSSVGACDPGVLTCTGGALDCVGDVPPAAETCNNVDDDCDTRIDEGNPGGGASCGSSVGACRPGTLTCSGGALVCTGGVTPIAEACNTIDDDCDTRIDEGNPGGGASCGTGTGECAPGTLTCSGGTLACFGAVGPTSELCDGRDNDCDGPIDEGNPGGGAGCGSSVGTCRPGTLACSGGTLTCTGGVQPVAEACDSLDNDCDGLVDEGNPGGGAACGSTTGECRAGALTCNGGMLTCIGGVGPRTEICDNRDNDCDGPIDEGNPGGGATCGSGIGACRTGTLACTSGALTCTGGVGPIAEACNSIDDDCDGNTDESVPTRGPCGSGEGECEPGVDTCVSGSFTCVGARGPVTEICDGRDNDCDALTDEGNPGGGAACGTATGECTEGSTECMGGALTCIGGVSSMPEACNTLDDDCDGIIDEDNPGGGGACGATDVGLCERGAQVCMGGALVCVGETGPAPEQCDGLDNDCDGPIDEGNPEGGVACGDDTGECMPGITECTGGELVCMGARGPTPEVCNALDDDCDGEPDDGLSVGAPCGSDVGECSPGRRQCVMGMIQCVGSIDGMPEECDALDNDCDGTVDEELALGGPCGSDVGLCDPGVEQCIRGVIRCMGGVEPAREICDCLDNDCDGMVDEEAVGSELCPAPSACVSCQCALECVESEFGRCPSGRAPVDSGGRCYCVAELCNADDCAADMIERDGVVLCAPDRTDVGECTCRNNACTFGCDGVVCGEGTVCDPRDPRGVCVEDSCRSLGCPDGEICDTDTGECVVDPCEAAGCAADEACRGGTCETSCGAVMCAAGEICHSGACETDACAGVDCASGEVCNPADGACVDDLCDGVSCPPGTVCDPVSGDCPVDPCLGLRCPAEETCVDGECERDDPMPMPDAGMMREDAGTDAGRGEEDPADRVLAAGGCVCRVGSARSGTGAIFLALFVLSVLVIRRRRRGWIAVAAIAVIASGCTVEPYCLDCVDGGPDTGIGGMDAAVDSGSDERDAGRDAGPPTDGCVPIGPGEACNGRDDDCDDSVDEGFDLMTSLEHCGECNFACAPPHAFGVCVDGMCGVASCDVGFHDLDGDVENGCEYRCLASETDDAICDLRDNDCDGDVDEDVAFDTDPANCGSCGRSCRFAHAVAGCTAGDCSIASCDAGFIDFDGVLDNGCEFTCTPDTPPDELCDSRDNDCDRMVDEGDPEGGGACGSDVGDCTMGIERCMGGALVCQGSVAPTTETCDGGDEDCDGTIDEGNPDGGRLCGDDTGACARGREVCTGGALVCTGQVGPSAESCNGLDDDCDGTVDDGDPGGGAACGNSEGECAPGVEHCRNGIVVCEGATGPIAEICDGLDQDCDMMVDEGNPGGGGSCGTDVGTCSPGTRRCMGGALVCTGEVGPSPELCDSLDNDCDGTIDDGNPESGASCGLTTGECTGGTEQCLAGTLVCQGGNGPVAESCDTLDNDCDGSVDEGNPGGGAACGSSVGTCRAGTTTCTAGAITCVGSVGPGTESCDSLDNDCDGNVDEGNPGGGGTCGIDTGACSFGTRTCVAGSLQCTGGVGPTSERCNGIDDDCDGMADENNPEGGSACGSSTGACRPGTVTCTGGALTCTGGTGPVAETCNGVDDNCNGSTDEGNPGGGASCGMTTGACEPGAMTCVSGSLTCVGGTGPTAETCNGVDDNCNGSTDEGNPGGGASCGIDTGACSFGAIACVGGALTCTGGTGPVAESCNNTDDDCDASVDEGNPGGGGLCGSDVGQCSPGTRVCTGGALVCTGGTGPSSETCNGLDDDCDGNVDNGNPGGGGTCGIDTGACSFGTRACIGGTLQCTGGTGPSAETCNMIDDDCDAATDEGFNLMNDRNNCGMCGNVCSFPNATAGCSGGSCVLLSCNSGFVNADMNPANGCEYACSFAGAEACNGRDDDCDTRVDESVMVPANFCNPNGVCAGTSATCGGTMGWVCNYPATYQTTETRCDGLDNDCDGGVDEPFPLVGTSCFNGVGTCRRNGTYVCNAAQTGVMCNAPPAGTPGTETCNGLDDDCDGTLDDFVAGSFVPITGQFGATWMFAYEASRPDATLTSAGTMTHRACSAPDVLPWTNLTQPEAEAACAAAGGRLCSEVEWQSGCRSSTGTCTWSYATSCTTYSASTCNGNDYDTDGNAGNGDQDAILATEQLTSCYANWGGTNRIYDMSGNAEEWTIERAPGVNPLRGGSANDTQGGIACNYNFTVAGDTVQFPTVGFRCCRDNAPSCGNGVRDGAEEGVDCGGGCGPCTCTMNSQCTSNLCMAGQCRPACDQWGSIAGVNGYRGCRHYYEGTPPCDDISATGTVVTLGDDAVSGSIALNGGAGAAFSFRFFDTNYTSVRIQSNGVLSFADNQVIPFTNTALPVGSNPDENIYAFWDDLDSSTGGGIIRRQTLGTAPNRRFVVQWRVEHAVDTPNTIDVRVVLHETTNHITVCYVDSTFGDVTYDFGQSATAGIQRTTLTPLQYSFNAPNLHTGLVLDYLHN